jgi:hypothetical protein
LGGGLKDILESVELGNAEVAAGRKDGEESLGGERFRYSSGTAYLSATQIAD